MQKAAFALGGADPRVWVRCSTFSTRQTRQNHPCPSLTRLSCCCCRLFFIQAELAYVLCTFLYVLFYYTRFSQFFMALELNFCRSSLITWKTTRWNLRFIPYTELIVGVLFMVLSSDNCHHQQDKESGDRICPVAHSKDPSIVIMAGNVEKIVMLVRLIEQISLMNTVCTCPHSLPFHPSSENITVLS